jgi:hypothetical protein
MDMAWIWKSAFLVIAGMLLLRIAGRKSISQMSVGYNCNHDLNRYDHCSTDCLQ